MGAVACGLVPEGYLDLALSTACGIEVPSAPAGNLVLAKCIFKDNAFAADTDGGCPGKFGHGAISSTGPVAAVEGAVGSTASKLAFEDFMRELREEIAPRMVKAFHDHKGCETKK